MSGKKEIKKIKLTVDKIIGLKEYTKLLSDSALRNKTWEFKRRIAEGESLDDLLPEAFAVVREAARRVLGMEHFEVQLIGGIVLHQGRIAEMRTGEGKTLVSTAPAYLNALSGKGVHIVTVNDYLAKRDRDQMGKVHEFLGLTVGVVLNKMTADERKKAYDCDITYVTNSELGFDYLRDNMAVSAKQQVQRGFNFAIIDEVDSVLIDDARTPLIISGKAARSTKLYQACDVLARRMTRGEDIKELSKLDIISGVEQRETGDFAIIEKDRQVVLTAAGIRKVERFFRIDNIADIENIDIQCHMNLALRANNLLERDKDYVVKDGEVFIVDATTGRIMQGRRYSDGLHQAIEAKEKVKIQKESRTIATVTYQNFFNKYVKKSGMTGTGKTEEEEFVNTYGMDIVEIPTNRPVLRIDKEDVVFRTRQDKFNAVCDAVIECRKSKRPVLVGTTSISDSEKLSHMLIERGIRHKVLNAKHHEMEAVIVAEAGFRGAVTIATNMAGRGTDIKLDDKAKAAGGLLVIGTERYDSRRVDGQLRGRSGRQGDPGESRFYISLEDDLFRNMDKNKLSALFEAHDVKEGEGACSAALTKLIEKMQKRIEMDHFAQRRQVLEYDEVLNEQRETIYEWRNRVLKENDSHQLITKLLRASAADILENAAAENDEKRRQTAVLAFADVLAPYAIAECKRCDMANLADCIARKLIERYECIADNYSGSDALWERERELLLKTTDKRWMEHIEAMKQLRQGIGLVSYAQRDPLVEYRIDAFRLFEQMNMNIRYDTVMSILGIEGVKVRE